jgi:putative DNA primase/helicase
MRLSSSEGDNKIVKGTPNGRAQVFLVRSSFILASINAQIEQKSDESRITVVELAQDNRPDGEVRFQEIERETHELLTPEFCASLRARALRMAPTIRKNARTFAIAASEKLGERRLGDQYGTLYAGTYALHSDQVISVEGARDFISKRQWAEVLTGSSAAEDKDRCLECILQSVIDTGQAGKRKSVSELIDLICAGTEDPCGASAREAADLTLRRHGLAVETAQGLLHVACRHKMLSSVIFKETQWEGGNHARLLERLDSYVGTSRPRLTGGRPLCVSLRLGDVLPF